MGQGPARPKPPGSARARPGKPHPESLETTFTGKPHSRENHMLSPPGRAKALARALAQARRKPGPSRGLGVDWARSGPGLGVWARPWPGPDPARPWPCPGQRPPPVKAGHRPGARLGCERGPGPGPARAQRARHSHIRQVGKHRMTREGKITKWGRLT